MSHKTSKQNRKKSPILRAKKQLCITREQQLICYAGKYDAIAIEAYPRQQFLVCDGSVPGESHKMTMRAMLLRYFIAGRYGNGDGLFRAMKDSIRAAQDNRQTFRLFDRCSPVGSDTFNSPEVNKNAQRNLNPPQKLHASCSPTNLGSGSKPHPLNPWSGNVQSLVRPAARPKSRSRQPRLGGCR